ncbi:MAG: hypothetical protein MJK14_10265 [Rivularia sp. ALOHA_DT_140]|nr:hypothetical protein [Rivularia sp. ALOHA_DT_140]
MKEWLGGNYIDDLMASKKYDPSYSELRGHIPKELYKKFKFYCLEHELDNSEGLEEILRKFFENNADKSLPEDSL